MKIARTVADPIGYMLLVRINRLARDCHAEAVARLSYPTPGLSVHH